MRGREKLEQLLKNRIAHQEAKEKRVKEFIQQEQSKMSREDRVHHSAVALLAGHPDALIKVLPEDIEKVKTCAEDMRALTDENCNDCYGRGYVVANALYRSCSCVQNNFKKRYG